MSEIHCSYIFEFNSPNEQKYDLSFASLLNYQASDHFSDLQPFFRE